MAFTFVHFNKILSKQETAKVLKEFTSKAKLDWDMSFEDVGVSLKSTLLINLKGLKVKWNKKDLWSAKEININIPYPLLLFSLADKIDVFVNDVSVNELSQMEEYFRFFIKQEVGTKEIKLSVPQYIANSVYNIRVNRVFLEENHDDVLIKKLYFLNVDSSKPTAFELILPYQKEFSNLKFKGDFRLLGEYMLNKDKVDLNYFIKNKALIEVAGVSKYVDVTVDGKGFYHSNLGFFTTLSVNEPWINFAGDLEFLKDKVNLSIPRINLAKSLLLDLLPFNGIKNKDETYQGKELEGSLGWSRKDGVTSYKYELKEKDKEQDFNFVLSNNHFFFVDSASGISLSGKKNVAGEISSETLSFTKLDDLNDLMLVINDAGFFQKLSFSDDLKNELIVEVGQRELKLEIVNYFAKGNLQGIWDRHQKRFTLLSGENISTAFNKIINLNLSSLVIEKKTFDVEGSFLMTPTSLKLKGVASKDVKQFIICIPSGDQDNPVIENFWKQPSFAYELNLNSQGIINSQIYYEVGKDKMILSFNCTDERSVINLKKVRKNSEDQLYSLEEVITP